MATPKLRGNQTIQDFSTSRNKFYGENWKPTSTGSTSMTGLSSLGERNKTNITPQSSSIGSSYSKMMGGGGGGGFDSAFSSLEGASMRLADAAAARERQNKEFEANLEARRFGYKDLSGMQSDIERKRQEEENLKRNAPGGWRLPLPPDYR